MPNKKGARSPKIRRSSYAELDLITIWTFIAQEDPIAADRTLKKIDRQTNMLAHAPFMGRNRSDIRRGLHSFPVERYLIYYTINNNDITIARILHSSRDLKSQF